MLAKAILVHGVIGYKFCWLLPEDQNQGTPAGHESNGTTVRDHWEDMNQLRHQLGTYHLWLRNFILGLAIVDTIEKQLYCDNFAAIFFSKNDKYSNGAKQMELKYFVVKEEVHKQWVSIEHINTKFMVADPLTKGLPPKTFLVIVGGFHH